VRQAGPELPIRSFREGDEAVLCQLFNSYLADFFGPIRLTPREWRAQFRQQSWTGPSLTEDADACRIAEARGKIQGYAITDYQPNGLTGAAVLQELCTAEEANTDQVMRALLEDAERRARERGKLVLMAQLSPEDGRASAAVEEQGFDSQLDDGEVFMAAVTSLPGLLTEMEPALSARLKRSALSAWRGEINVSCGGQSAGLEVRTAGVSTGPPVERPAIRVSVRPDALPLLLSGREPVGELYVQDCLSVEAPNAGEALRLLDVLFPRVPIFLPRAQWW
jgi:GNAT superfamily N-acetyltransferase